MLRRLSVLTLAVAACHSDPKSTPTAPPPGPPPAAAGTGVQNQPSTQSPADVSHGEAKIGNPAVPLERPAEAPPRTPKRVKRIHLTAVNAPHLVAPGIIYEAWTFDSMVPGPTLRATVGDTVEVTVVNHAPMSHSIDFHAAEIAPSRVYININPKDSITFRFVPRVPGVFLYHCGTAPAALHIANGMYGALIIDPARPRPRAHEFVLVQSEFYFAATADSSAPKRLDWQKMLDQAPDYVVFNGEYGQYAAHPLQVQPGELVRLYVVDAGPNRISSFHLVGGIFSRVYEDGFGPPLQGVQTFMVPVGGGMIFETRLPEAGLYPFVSHMFADATKGAMGVLRAGDITGTMAH